MFESTCALVVPSLVGNLTYWMAEWGFLSLVVIACGGVALSAAAAAWRVVQRQRLVVESDVEFRG